MLSPAAQRVVEYYLPTGEPARRGALLVVVCAIVLVDVKDGRVGKLDALNTVAAASKRVQAGTNTITLERVEEILRVMGVEELTR